MRTSRIRRLRARSATSVLALAATQLIVVAWAPPAAAATFVTHIFNFAGGVQQSTVPANAVSATINMTGAAGAASSAYPGILSNRGGWGGSAQATITVTPNAVLDVYVGGRAIGPTGGFNGGGNGGAADCCSQSLSGGGGGASDVRPQGGDLASRLVVAGGGGGGGAYSVDSTSGIGGAGAENGAAGSNGAPVGTTGGGGGTQAAGGAGGTAGSTATEQYPGSAGSLGNGGAGGADGYYHAGGGGGGGYFGGGGGGTGYIGGGGGGGSSYGPAGSTFGSGSESGSGVVIITYTVLTAPTLTTGVSAATVTVGSGPIFDNATLAGGDNPTGTLTFNAYGPNDPTCTGTPAFNEVWPVNGNATIQSNNLNNPQVGTYRWIASYSGDANNTPVSGSCGDASETTVVNQAVPTLTTQVSAATVPVGTNIYDSATLAGGYNPTGTLTFNAYGPDDPNCTGTSVFNEVWPVTGNATIQSNNLNNPAAGTYRWIASYSGDANNAAVSGACNDPNETTVVQQLATPTITTQSSPDGALGDVNISDTATVTGLVNPVGFLTLTFQLYGPDDATCANPPVFTTGPYAIPPSGIVNANPYGPTAPGTYRWRVFYAGDANNNAVSTPCNDTNESTVISKANPFVSTTATTNVAVGQPISDSAQVFGVNPTGTVTFNLYGDGDVTCTATPIFTSVPQTLVSGVAGSGAFTPTAPGTYRWVASYSGDTNHNASTNACGDSSEISVVTKASPTISTTASPGGPPGTPVTDTATVSGGFNPTGTVTFRLFTSNACTTQVFTSTNGLAGGSATSGSFAPAGPGTYFWTATYSGDANNNPALSACNAPNESVTITQATPTVTTQATPTAQLGQPISDTATITGGFNPTGTVTFTLYAPGDTTCTGTPVFTSANRPITSGTATSAAFTTTQVGTYRWRATYNGDANNNVVAAPCNAPNESSEVTGADLVATKSGPATVTAGQNYTYTVGVTNNGPSTAQNVVLTDTLPSGVTFVSAPGCTAVGQTVTCPIGTLTPGQSASRTITVTPNVTNPFGTVLTNVVTVSSSTGDPTPGNNTATVTSTQSGCTTNGTVGTAGNDVFCPSASPRTINGGAGNDVIYGSPGAETLQGGDGDDVIFGGGGNDTIQGGNGNDTMYGQDGNDTLQGGAGTDYADGGPGSDISQTNETSVNFP